MAKVLLRRAAQIVNRINAESAFEVEQTDDDYPYGRRRKKKVTTLNATATFDIDSNVDRIRDMREDFVSHYDRMFKLMEIGTRIRKAVAEKQALCGISAMVTGRVMVVRQITVVTHLLEQTGHDTFDILDFQKKVTTARDRAKSGVGSAPTEVQVVLVDSGLLSTIKAKQKELRRCLIDIDDRLGELNSTNSITIDDDDMTVLANNGIV